MVFDSLAALVLFAACVSAWPLTAAARAGARPNIRFAAMLFAALSVARLLGVAVPQFLALAPAVAMIAAALGSSLVALALFCLLARPLPAGIGAFVLAMALGLGLAGALSGAPAYAAGCALACALLVLGAGLNRFSGAFMPLLAALALCCGGFSLMDGAINPAEMFFAAALIAAASQTRVETQGYEPHRTAVKVRS